QHAGRSVGDDQQIGQRLGGGPTVNGLGPEGGYRFLGLFRNQPGPQLTVLVGHAPLHPEGVVKLADLRRGHAGSSSRLGSGVGSCTGASAGAGIGSTSMRRIGSPMSAICNLLNTVITCSLCPARCRASLAAGT